MRAMSHPPELAALFAHGGNLAAARAAFPDAPQPWLDVSTGISPFPYPLPTLPPEAWTRLPEPADVAALEAAAGACYGAPADRAVVAAPGTQAILQALPYLHPAARVGILAPTYAEHAAAWRAAGAVVVETADIADLARCDSAVVVNPNNPDGRRLPPEALLDLARTLAARGGRLVVDEAFVDPLGAEASCVPALPARGLVVLRSFGKAYGLAGLRLGFALAAPEDIAPLRRAFGPWAVGGAAVAIGRRALADEAWRRVTWHRLTAAAARLDALLVEAGLEMCGGTPLFRLARAADGPALFRRLACRGILVRPLPFDDTLLRFGLPKDDTDTARLAAALRA